jgi:hypothetical protein
VSDAQSVEVQPRPAAYVVFGLLALCCGVGIPLFFYVSRQWPKQIDAEGVTRRDGKRFRWEEATGAQYLFDTSAQANGSKRLPDSDWAVGFGAYNVFCPYKSLGPREEIERIMTPVFARISTKLTKQA